MKEVRLHGRGGQGMVLASEIIVYAVMIGGDYGNALPFFGGERRGSPVACSVRIDHQPIREKTQIYTPDCIVVGDPTLLGSVNVFSGVKKEAIMVLNSPNDLTTLVLPPQITRVGIVDATRIAIEVLGIPVTNTAMLGAFARTTEWIQIASACEGIRHVMPEKLAGRNVQAACRAAQEIHIFNI